MRIVIYPYKRYSSGARELVEAIKSRGIKVKKILPDVNFLPKKNDVVINWGNSTTPSWLNSKSLKTPEGYTRIFNHPDNVQEASNKLWTFNRLKENNVSIPEYTESQEVAREWVNAGDTVFARHLLRSHSGNGIEVCTLENPIQSGIRWMPIAPLYVKYIKKKYEYRIHVFNGNIIHIQQKRKAVDFPKELRDSKIRNHKNGWNFAHLNIIEPNKQLLKQAMAAVSAMGLNFGAVDVIWNDKQQKAYVLEVNTAPGLEGSTIDKYIEAFLSY